MAAAAVNQIYRVILRGTLCSQQLQTTFDYRINQLTVPHDVSEVYSDIAAVITEAGGLVEKFLDCVPSNYTCVDAFIQCIYPTRVRGGVVIVNLPGERAASDASNISANVQRFGELAARRAVGGVRVPVSTDPADIAIGFVTAGQFTALNALGTAMTVAINGPDTGAVLQPVIYNRSFIPNYSTVTGASAKNTVRTMHRRTVGLGK